MKRHLLLSLCFVALATACAPRPDAIAPADMPDGLYSSMSCNQARAEHARVTAGYDALAKQQNSAATGDAIGVFLIGLPMGSVTGGDKSGQIATEKGKLIGLQARLAGC